MQSLVPVLLFVTFGRELGSSSISLASNNKTLQNERDETVTIQRSSHMIACLFLSLKLVLLGFAANLPTQSPGQTTNFNEPDQVGQGT